MNIINKVCGGTEVELSPLDPISPMDIIMFIAAIHMVVKDVCCRAGMSYGTSGRNVVLSVARWPPPTSQS